jgi:hypothetical protein
MKKYSDSITLDRWRDLANIGEIRKNLNEGGTISYSDKAPNGVTYGIIRENHNYFIKTTKEQKDLYVLNDYKYLNHNNLKEGRFDCYSSALKRLNGMFNVLKEEIKYKEAVNELTTTTGDGLEDDDALFADLEALDNTEVKPEEPVVSNEPMGDITPDAEIPTGDSVPTETPIDSNPEPMGDVAPEGDVEAPSEPTSDNADGGDGSADYNEIQSLLGKIQNTISNMETITPEQTKSIMNSVISSTKTGLQGLEDKDKEKLSNRILQGGEKMDEEIGGNKTSNALNKIEGAIKDLESNGGDEEKITKLKELRDIMDNISLKETSNTTPNLKEYEIEMDDDYHPIEGKDDKTFKPAQGLNESKISKYKVFVDKDDTGKKKTITTSASNEAEAKKIVCKHLNCPESAIEKVELISELNESIKNIVSEELKRNLAKDLIKKSLIHLKESEKKNSNLKKEQTIFYETFQRLSESEYDSALELVKQYVENPEGLTEGAFGDKLKTLAKPFVIAAFMSVMGGEVNAAVQKYQEATGITPTEQEIKAGVNEFKKHSSTDTQTQTDNGGIKDELDKLMMTPNATVVKVGEEKLDNNGKKKTEKYNVTLPSTLVDARGPRLHNQGVLGKAFDELDDTKDSERLEKVWDMISYNPDEAISDGVVKNSKGEVLGSNIKLEGDSITYDFVFKNNDSKQFTDGKTPVKMLAGKLVKGEMTPITSNKVWALYKNAGVYSMNPNMMKENPQQYVKTLEKLIKAGYEPIQGTYNWQRSEKGSWVDEKEAIKLFKDGEIRFNDEGLNKEYIQKSNTSQTSDDFKGQAEPVVR